MPSQDGQHTPQSTAQYMKRQTMRDNDLHPSPRMRETQTDIRNFFQPAPKSSPSEAPRSGNLTPRSKNQKFHEALFEEWKAPVYRPPSARRIPNAKSRSQPATPEKDHAYASSKALSSAPLISTRISTVIDEDLIPKPLKLSLPPAGSRPAVQHTQLSSRRYSPPPPSSSSEGTCNLIAAIDTKGSFRKSRVLSLFEKQGLGIEQSFADLSIRSQRAKRKSDAAMMVPVALEPAMTSLGLGNEEDAVIYFLPSPESTLGEPARTERNDLGRSHLRTPRGEIYGMEGAAGNTWRDGSKKRQKIQRVWSTDESDEQVAVSPYGMFSQYHLKCVKSRELMTASRTANETVTTLNAQ